MQGSKHTLYMLHANHVAAVDDDNDLHTQIVQCIMAFGHAWRCVC